ncbi:MAG: protein kinase domain-containing protein [Acidimicrobiales bacterium]
MSEARIVGNRYRLGEVLGRGGMGEVLLAEDLQLRRSVAVKMLHAELLDHRDSRRRFEDEARAAARLTHPNVVGVYDIGEHRGAPYLVMERMDGPSLAAVLTRGPLPAERVRRLGLDVLGALAAAHAEGIVHRDIKPSNVLLTSLGDAKLADFGAAKSNRGSSHTVFGVVVGTPAYLAPERLAGEPASVSSDLYAVGVLLYEALSGRRPFSADSALRTLSEANWAELDRWYDGRPAEANLAAVIEQALDPIPSGRYRSAEEMAHALSQTSLERDVTPTEFLELSTLLREPGTEGPSPESGAPSDPTLYDRRANGTDRRGSEGERRHAAAPRARFDQSADPAADVLARHPGETDRQVANDAATGAAGPGPAAARSRSVGSASVGSASVGAAVARSAGARSADARSGGARSAGARSGVVGAVSVGAVSVGSTGVGGATVGEGGARRRGPRVLHDPAYRGDRRRLAVMVAAMAAMGLVITLAKTFDDSPAAAPITGAPLVQPAADTASRSPDPAAGSAISVAPPASATDPVSATSTPNPAPLTTAPPTAAPPTAAPPTAAPSTTASIAPPGSATAVATVPTSDPRTVASAGPAAAVNTLPPLLDAALDELEAVAAR